MQPRRHSAESEEHGIDLAPMLDFTLNLLIFFMATSFIKQPGVTVQKPAAETAQHRQNGNILIAVRENGQIWLDRHEVSLRQVRTKIERMHIERPADTVVIVADKASKAGMVAKVMDEVQRAGIKEVAIAAKPGGQG
jgi:biopolymer transport protein ExbD